MDAYIILDIGGTYTRCAVYSEKNELSPISINKIRTYEENQGAIERIVSVISEMWPSNYSVRGISMAAPGSIDVNKGIVIFAPNIPGWTNINLREIISGHFGVDVYVNNDARLAAIGEWRRGAGVGHQNILYFTISTGVGGGVIHDGHLIEGSIGIATELGHVTIDENGPICGCGHHGHLEAFSSGTAIANFYHESQNTENKAFPANGNTISAKEIAELARQGDVLALSAYDRAGYFLGIGVANYLHIFNPTCVIFGGGVSLSADLFLEPFRKSLESHVLSDNYVNKLVISTASLRDNAGLIGALEYLKEKKASK